MKYDYKSLFPNIDFEEKPKDEVHFGIDFSEDKKYHKIQTGAFVWHIFEGDCIDEIEEEKAEKYRGE